MTELKYTGKVTRRIEGFGKFKSGAVAFISTEKDVDTLMQTGLFKKVEKTKPPKSTEPPDKKKEVEK